MQMLKAEFGGATALPLNAYYRGAGLVPDTPQNAGVPTSGPISLSQFYGTASVSILPAGFYNLSISGIPVGNAAFIGIQLFSSGTAFQVGTFAGSPHPNPNVQVANWLSPTTPGIGSNYQAQFIPGSTSGAGVTWGGSGSAAMNTWLLINTNLTFLLKGGGNSSGTGTLQIRSLAQISIVYSITVNCFIGT